MPCRFVVSSLGLSALCPGLMNSNGTLALLDCCDQTREDFIIQNGKVLGHAQDQVPAALENCRISWTSWLPPPPSSIPSIAERGVLQPGWTVLNQPVCMGVVIDFPVVVTGRRGAERPPLNSSLLPLFEGFLGGWT